MTGRGEWIQLHAAAVDDVPQSCLLAQAAELVQLLE